MTTNAFYAMLSPPGRLLGFRTRLSDGERAQRFKLLFEAQFDRVHAYLRYQVGDTSTAEDLAAEVFSRAWTKLNDPGGERAVGWLLRTAHNVAIDYHRRRRRSIPIDAIPVAAQPISASTESDLLENERQSELRRCLTVLNARERDVVGLRFVARLRNRQIAELVGTSEGNVAKILHRALRKVRVEMNTGRSAEESTHQEQRDA